MRFHQLLHQLGTATSPGMSDPELTNVNTLEEATPQDLAFLENKQFYPQLQTTKAGALILPDEPGAIASAQAREIPFIAVTNPRLLFAQAMKIFYPDRVFSPGIHPTAVVAKSAQIGANVSIDAHCVIGEQVSIGDHVKIYPNVTIYDQVTIGNNTTIHAQCVFHSNTTIGNNCLLHSGVVIGDEGFGFVPINGTWTKMPQVGKVVIEDNVEIGCNSAVDRGALGITRIGKGTKIDNLVQVGHGCTIGENSLLAGQVGLAGGVKLGKNVVLAGQVGVSNHIQIGERSVIAAQSGISDDVPPDSRQMGYPAFDSKQFFKATALFRRLPEIYRIIKQLQAKL